MGCKVIGNLHWDVKPSANVTRDLLAWFKSTIAVASGMTSTLSEASFPAVQFVSLIDRRTTQDLIIKTTTDREELHLLLLCSRLNLSPLDAEPAGFGLLDKRKSTTCPPASASKSKADRYMRLNFEAEQQVNSQACALTQSPMNNFNLKHGNTPSEEVQ